MAIAHLHKPLIDALIPKMNGWTYVGRNREFKRRTERVRWYMHLSFINHPGDFDSVTDVAVEFLRGNERVGIVGAQLGNITGVGQTRFSVKSAEDIPAAAEAIVAEFNAVGLPFLKRFSTAEEVIAVLRRGGPEAHLISSSDHRALARALEQLEHAN